MEHPLRRPELFVCSWRGHFAPGTVVLPLDERHTAIGRETVDGRRFAKCLRCGDWILAGHPDRSTTITLDAITDLPRPRRGHALREAIILRVIAIDRAVHAAAFGAVACAALAVRWNLNAIHGWSSGILNALASARTGHGGASTHGLTAALLTRLGHVQPHSLLVLAMFAAVYAVVSTFEAIGLWRERRWAEYLTALATTGFLPVEIHELVKRITFVRVAALTVNIAILIYLVVTKHLFGIRGPIQHEPPEPLQALPELTHPPRPNPGDETTNAIT